MINVKQIQIKVTSQNYIVVLEPCYTSFKKPEIKFCANSNVLAECRRFAKARISESGHCWE